MCLCLYVCTYIRTYIRVYIFFRITNYDFLKCHAIFIHLVRDSGSYRSHISEANNYVVGHQEALTACAVVSSGEYGELYTRVSYRTVDNEKCCFITIIYDLRSRIVFGTDDVYSANRAL
jgi:hypothetical protein